MCLHHDRELREPNLFSSRQPTRLVLEHAKFGIPEVEVDTSRARDRRRMLRIREAFFEDQV